MPQLVCHVAVSLCALILLAGCTNLRSSETARTGMEQLLISNAVDQSLDKTDFRPLNGQNVYLEEKYLDCTDKNYIIGTLRHRILHAGANLVAKPEEADVVVEARSGGVGTDRADSFVGMPGIAIPGPMPISLPEVRLWNKSSQTATAKIGLVAYDAKSKALLGDGGVSLAKSDDNNWYLLGVGPFQNGSVRNEVGKATAAGTPANKLPYNVALGGRRQAPGRADVQYAGATEGEGVEGATELPTRRQVQSPEFEQ